MLKEKQIHQDLILKLVSDHFKKNDFDMSDFKDKSINYVYARLYNLGSKDLCFEILPYLQFERNNTFVCEILKYKKEPQFKDILYDAILNNSEILEGYSYDKYVLYRKCMQVLPDEQLQKLDQKLFSSFVNHETKEIQVESISFHFNPASLYQFMNEDLLFKSGKSQVDEFINFIKHHWELKNELKIDLILDYYTDISNRNITFVNPQDKILVTHFMEHIPLIFNEILQVMDTTECSENNFSKHQNIVFTHLQAMKLDYGLDRKDEIHVKIKKI